MQPASEHDPMPPHPRLTPRTGPRRLARLAARALPFALLMPTAAQAVPGDAQQPANITADNCTYDYTKEVSVCTGKVEVHQGTLRVDADLVRVVYRNKKVLRLTAEGDPAQYEQQLEEGKGVVEADAKTIVYYTSEERVEFLGEAYLRQEGSDIQGDVIHYDMVAGRVTASPSENGRVSVTLQPAAPGDDS